MKFQFQKFVNLFLISVATVKAVAPTSQPSTQPSSQPTNTPSSQPLQNPTSAPSYKAETWGEVTAKFSRSSDIVKIISFETLKILS